MALAKNNPLLKYLLILVVIILAAVFFKGGGETQAVDNKDGRALRDELERLNIPDGDTSVDTVRTLVAKVQSYEEQSKELLEELQRLRKENADIDGMVQKQVDMRTRQLQANMAKQNQNQFKKLTNSLDLFKSKLNVVPNKSTVAMNSTPNQSVLTPQDDIPIGLGFDESYSNMHNGWIMPEDLPTMDKEGRYQYAHLDDELNQTLDSIDPQQNHVTSEPADIPVYTVPENATLLGTIAMTGLVGRIPVSGRIVDPYPFKIITSAENLATNGIYIPGLEGMTFSGIATGDLMLQCVKASLYSVTYTFTDGTIRTIREESGAGVNETSDDGTERRGLGWISDEWGNPCIPGELITNAPVFLATMFGLSAAEGWANAYAEAETSSVVTSAGAIVTQTTGDPYKKAAGDALGSGVADVKNWVKQRMTDSFDAIYVPSGVQLAVHIDTQLNIDYEPNGRKVAYEHNTSPYSFGLD